MEQSLYNIYLKLRGFEVHGVLCGPFNSVLGGPGVYVVIDSNLQVIQTGHSGILIRRDGVHQEWIAQKMIMLLKENQYTK